VDIGTYVPSFTTTSATTLPSASASPTPSAVPSLHSATTQLASTPSPTSDPSDAKANSLQEKSNTIAIAVGISIPLMSLGVSAAALWIAYRKHKLEPMKRVIESLRPSRTLSRGRSAQRDIPSRGSAEVLGSVHPMTGGNTLAPSNVSSLVPIATSDRPPVASSA
jgi:hypothetical protein